MFRPNRVVLLSPCGGKHCLPARSLCKLLVTPLGMDEPFYASLRKFLVTPLGRDEPFYASLRKLLVTPLGQ